MTAPTPAGTYPAADYALGNWKISADGMFRRDRLVIELLRHRRRRLPLVILLAAIMVMIGWGAGDLIWRGLSSGSQGRVKALTERLTTEATRLLPPPGERDAPQESRPEPGLFP